MKPSNIIEPKRSLPNARKPFDNAALKAMIVPLLIEQLLQMVVGIADTLMVSYAGEATVSGVSLDTMLYTIFIYIFTAIASGGAVVVSQYLGSRDRGQAENAAGQIFRLSLVVSFSCMALMLVFGNAILRLLYSAVEPDVMRACRVYLSIVVLSFPANAVYNAGAALYRSMGKTRTTMFVSICMNLMNVFGNAIGIFALHAGAAGVAWPTTISWYFAAVVMTILCMKEGNEVALRPRAALRHDSVMMKRILSIAIPNSIENGLFQLSKVVLGSLISTFGTAHIAANGIGQTFWSLAAVIGVAMGPVYITVIGRCMGADDVEAADYYLLKLTRLSLALAFVWNVVVLLIVPLALPLYSISAETKRLILIIVVIHNAFSATVQPIGNMSVGLRAAGDVRFTMYTSIFCTVICRVALSFLLGLWMGLGVVGIAWAMVLDWTIKMCIILYRYKSGKWKNFRVIEKR